MTGVVCCIAVMTYKHVCADFLEGSTLSLHPRHLAHYMTHSDCAVNIYRMDEWLYLRCGLSILRNMAIRNIMN
jgi:hypothetical protein